MPDLPFNRRPLLAVSLRPKLTERNDLRNPGRAESGLKKRRSSAQRFPTQKSGPAPPSLRLLRGRGRGIFPRLIS
jgi:hypothetical protein